MKPEPKEAPNELEALREFCFAEMLAAQRGTASEDPGRASAYARVINEIRRIQRGTP